MSPKEAATLLRRAAAELRAAKVEIPSIGASLALSEAQALSRGTMTEAFRRANDYPYAMRHGSFAFGDPAEINVGSGAFLANWHIERTGEIVAVVNDSGVAGYLKHGTRLMIQRPIEERIAERVIPHYRIGGELAVSKALRVLGG